ncbi:LPXTG cell wall anchor domain-containing protein, partial [Streptococcus parasanguinis]
ATPENPGTTENPGTPENPATPENPGTPENPATPENPGTTENPATSENQGSKDDWKSPTTQEALQNSKEESLAKSSGNGGGHKSLLPSTGEVVATGLVFSGVLALVGAVSLKRKSSRK